jgi:hypothetical protein
MIQSTTTDLQGHLRNIDDEMHNVSIGREYQSPVIDDMAMQSERDCTMQCLEICMRLDAVIEEQKLSMNNGKLDPTASGSSNPVPQRIIMDSLQSCKFNTQSANAELMKLLQYLSARLGSGTTDPLRASPSDPSEHERMTEEFENIRQCLNICMRLRKKQRKFVSTSLGKLRLQRIAGRSWYQPSET